jgi:hypothetical protein
MRTIDYAGISRNEDTLAYQLLPKLEHLILEGVAEDGNLIWSGHRDEFEKVELIVK